MGSRYFQIIEGLWTRVTRRNHRNMCCSCGHVHIIDYRLLEDGGLEVRFRTDNRATAAARRSLKPAFGGQNDP